MSTTLDIHSTNDTNSGFPRGYQEALVAAVVFTCVLSIIGSGMIILSFVLFRELRTTMRYILLHLSIADFIVAVTNLIGALYSLHFLRPGSKPAKNDPLCIIQGAVGLFSTDASILLTIVFIFYVYLLVTCYKPTKISNMVVVNTLTLLSWVFPFVLATVFAAEGYLGYRHEYSPRFCTIDVSNGQVFRQIVGYEIFLYFSFLTLPTLSIAFFCHLCYMQRKHDAFINNIEQFSIIRSAELKLIFVPILFMVIRVWGLILDIRTFYLSSNSKSTFERSEAVHLLLVFLTGIGISAQGFLNGIFFALLTPTVRKRLSDVFLKYVCCCHKRHKYELIIE